MEQTPIKTSILYVDDEEHNRIAFKSALRRFYDIYVAGSAEEGIAILQQQDIHIVITDQRMPDVTGVEFLERIIPLYPDCIRMILTGFSDVAAIIEAINKGQVYRYITKPWEKEELKITIDNAAEAYQLRRKNKELIKHLQEINQLLEEKVQIRTAELLSQKEKIEIMHHNLTSSIEYAKRIQSAMLPLPKRFDEIFGHENYFILFKPRDIVSGDFYWLHETKHEETNTKRCILAVADCTGHGVPGAFMSMIGNQILYEAVETKKIYAPHLILKELHREIRMVLKQEETESRDGMDIIIISIDQQTKTVEYAGAMNSLYYIKDGKLEEIRATKKTIGGFQHEEEHLFENHSIDITDACTFYLCTDGYQDQFGGEKNKKFMIGQLKKLLHSISNKAMKTQRQELDHALRLWQETGNEPQIDDITIVGIRL